MKTLAHLALVGLALGPATVSAERPAPTPAPAARPVATALSLKLADGRQVIVRGEKLYLVIGKLESLGPDGDYPVAASMGPDGSRPVESLGPDGNRPSPAALGPDGSHPSPTITIQVRSGKILNPGVLKGFNPQPEPPRRP